MVEDFSTIEHDFLQVRDYFNNYKFIYKERKSKLDFFKNINAEAPQDTTDLLNSSKEQLVTVKQIYKDFDEEIKSLSQEIYTRELENENKKQEISELSQEEQELIEKYERLCSIGEKLRVNESLNEEFDKIENEIKDMCQKIEINKEFLNNIDLNSKLQEEQELKNLKQELAAKQKRLTIINTDNYIEDIYSWYEGVDEFFRKLFGNITLQMIDDRCVIKIEYNDGNLEVILKNKRIHEINFNCSVSESLLDRIDEVKAYCSKIGDIRILFAFLLQNKQN